MACARRLEILTQSHRNGSTCWEGEEEEREGGMERRRERKREREGGGREQVQREGEGRREREGGRRWKNIVHVYTGTCKWEHTHYAMSLLSHDCKYECVTHVFEYLTSHVYMYIHVALFTAWP